MNKDTLIIGLIGGSGSGKTTLLRRIRDRYNIQEVCTLNMDDYYFPRDQQHVDPNGICNFDLPTALNAKKFIEDLKSLASGNTLKITEYTFNNSAKTPLVKIFEPAPVIVIEGLFLFDYEELDRLFDYRVFVHTREAVRLIRRIKRDRFERNYPLDDVLYRFQHHVLPSHDRYIEVHRDKCDLIVMANEGRFQKEEVLLDRINSFLASNK